MYLCVKIFNKTERKLSDVRLNTAVHCNSVKKKKVLFKCPYQKNHVLTCYRQIQSDTNLC